MGEEMSDRETKKIVTLAGQVIVFVSFLSHTLDLRSRRALVAPSVALLKGRRRFGLTLK
jgi:hypothetical protein